MLEVLKPNQHSTVSHSRFHSELLGFLSQRCSFANLRHLVVLSWMVAGLLLNQKVCFDCWKTVLPVGHIACGQLAKALSALVGQCADRRRAVV